jgi:hypothetical protein
MNTERLKKFSVLLASASLLALNPVPASADDSGKVRVNFEKCPGVIPPGAPADTVFWAVGKAKGAVKGDLVAVGQPGAFDQVDGKTYLEADYVVAATDGSQRSFIARVGGRMENDGTMRAILYGFVSDGWLRGAQVVDKFVGTGAGCVKGTLTITPRWASAHDDDED